MNNTQTTNSAVSPGYGYRLLDKDELLQQGDEWLNGSKWLETKSPGLRATCWTYRRKIDPGTGYVLLAEGSPVLAGDEFRTREGGWAPMWFACVSRKAGDYGDVCRRKVVSVKPSEGVLTNWIAAQGEALAKAREQIEELKACNVEAQHRLEHLSKQLEKKANELAQAQADKCDAEESASFYRGVNMALRDDLFQLRAEVRSEIRDEFRRNGFFDL